MDVKGLKIVKTTGKIKGIVVQQKGRVKKEAVFIPSDGNGWMVVRNFKGELFMLYSDGCTEPTPEYFFRGKDNMADAIRKALGEEKD
jgi:hypothetical protein